MLFFFFKETKFWFIIHEDMVFLLYLEVDVGVRCSFVLALNPPIVL